MKYSWMIILIFSTNLYAKSTSIGKFTYLRGNVFNNGSKVSLGDKVSESNIIETKKSSVARITMNDKSILTMAPNSKVEIKEFKQGKKNLIKILKGALRAKVPPEKKPSKKNKMIVSSQMASFGVRGTEILVTHNTTNNISNLLLFKGKATAANIGSGNSFSKIDQMLKRSKISVGKGQFVQYDPTVKNFSKPASISKAQFHSLRRNNRFKSSEKAQAVEKNSISIKGLSGRRISITDKTIKKESSNNGGYLDIKTSLYLPPSKKGSYDPNTNQYRPDPALGKVDISTGEYKAPEGLTLTPSGKFKVVDKTKFKGRPPRLVRKKPRRFNLPPRTDVVNDSQQNRLPPIPERSDRTLVRIILRDKD